MEWHYSTDRNVLNLVALLKAHEVKKIVASPGGTDGCLIASLQQDNYFEMYSCVDERSAAYMACGIAAESGEVVAIICTEATASRNYYPGLTEAYHRRLPILAITCMHGYEYIGNLEPQVIDRSISPIDTFKYKVHLPEIKDNRDVDQSVILINKAILELKRHGDGPVHIDMPWPGGEYNFSEEKLPDVRVLHRFYNSDVIPELPVGKIAIYCGVHIKWDNALIHAVEIFCSKYDCVVFGGPTNGYNGKYSIPTALLFVSRYKAEVFDGLDLIIHMGEEPDDYNAKNGLIGKMKEVWRVSPDGEIRDMFGKLTNVFEMEEIQFFCKYIDEGSQGNDLFLNKCRNYLDIIYDELPEVPFSNIYIASRIEANLPEKCVLHLGVSNTLRAWSLFEPPHSVSVNANLGCRGIDGSVSAVVGASLVNKNKLYYAVVGDLTFFYDMNAIGNRHIGGNLRLIIINNGGGSIFRISDYSKNILGVENVSKYIAAAGHFGDKSPLLVKHYAEDLGFEYLCASNKNELELACDRLLLPELTDKPMLLEVFTEDSNEDIAFSAVNSISNERWKKVAKSILGNEGTNAVKKFLRKRT